MAGPIMIAGFGDGGVPLLCVQAEDGNRAMAEQFYQQGRMMVWLALQKVPRYRVVARLKPAAMLPASMVHEMPEKMQ